MLAMLPNTNPLNPTNLRLVNWSMGDEGFDWAYEFDDFIKENIQSKNHENIINCKSLGQR